MGKNPRRSQGPFTCPFQRKTFSAYSRSISKLASIHRSLQPKSPSMSSHISVFSRLMLLLALTLPGRALILKASVAHPGGTTDGLLSILDNETIQRNRPF